MSSYREGTPVTLIAAIVICATVVVATSHAQANSCPATFAGAAACGSEKVGSYSPDRGSARFVANPVDVITGAKVESRVDYRAFGSRLGFARHYNSTGSDTNRGVGVNWRHAYDLSLSRLADHNGLQIVQADGQIIDFVTNPAEPGRWNSQDQRYGRISLVERHYVWAVPDGRRIFFPGMRPDRIEWADGDALVLSWQGNKLVRIVDRHSRALTLHWTPGAMPALRSFEQAEDVMIAGHLERIDLPDGTSIQYRYDNLHRLRAVYPADDASERYEYDDTHTFALTSVTDEHGTRQWRYQDDARVDLFTERDGRTLSIEYRERALSSDAAPDSESGSEFESDSDFDSGSTNVIREDGTRVVYDWRYDHASGATLDSVVEYPCQSCRGEVRDITPSQAANNTAESATVKTVEGVRIERLGVKEADVHVEALGESIKVSFDLKGKVSSMRPRDATRSAIRSHQESIELQRVKRVLDASASVDTSSGLVFNGEPTTTICPIAITRTCAELLRDLELAEISACAYEDGECNVDGWVQLSGEELRLDDSYLEVRNFRAVVYRNENTQEVVVGFRGTAGLGDAFADANQYENGPSRTYRNAIDLASRLNEEGIDVTYTGHSLGGGLATAAALQGSEQAVGFNSAALTVGFAERYGLDITQADNLVTHIIVPGEIVTTLQETPMQDPSGSGPHNDYGPNPLPWETNPAPGRRDVLELPSQEAIDGAIARLSWWVRVPLPRGLETDIALHMMTSVIASLEETIEARCP